MKSKADEKVARQMVLRVSRRTHFSADVHGRVCVVYIRKNACSALKAMILESIGEEGEGKTAIQKMVDYRLCSFEQAKIAAIRAFIIRDPFERIVSGWLNQVVQKVDRSYPEMFDGISLATGKHHQDVTFQQFVEVYLSGNRVNGHFTPVLNHLLPIKYTHVLYDKHLYDDAKIVFGEERAEKFFKRPLNATQLIKSVSVENADQLTALDIFKNYKQNSILPTKDSFMNPRTLDTIRKIYSGDFDLYEDYLECRSETNAPVALDLSTF